MTTYFTHEGKLNSSDSCKNISFSFDLKEEIQQLNISFCYEPKTLDSVEKSMEIFERCVCDYSCDEKDDYKKRFMESIPLNNLLTISVDDPNGFRGAAHRHPNRQHLFIRKDSASYGFIAGDVLKGKWSVTISVHSLVTESCSYKLHVWGGNDENEEMGF